MPETACEGNESFCRQLPDRGVDVPRGTLTQEIPGQTTAQALGCGVTLHCRGAEAPLLPRKEYVLVRVTARRFLYRGRHLPLPTVAHLGEDGHLDDEQRATRSIHDLSLGPVHTRIGRIGIELFLENVCQEFGSRAIVTGRKRIRERQGCVGDVPGQQQAISGGPGDPGRAGLDWRRQCAAGPAAPNLAGDADGTFGIDRADHRDDEVLGREVPPAVLREVIQGDGPEAFQVAFRWLRPASLTRRIKASRFDLELTHRRTGLEGQPTEESCSGTLENFRRQLTPHQHRGQCLEVRLPGGGRRQQRGVEDPSLHDEGNRRALAQSLLSHGLERTPQ